MNTYIYIHIYIYIYTCYAYSIARRWLKRGTKAFLAMRLVKAASGILKQ